MEISCIDPTNNGCCNSHSSYLEEHNQLPGIQDTRISIHSSQPSFIYLPYGNIKSNPYSDYNYKIQKSIKLNNNDNAKLPFERSNLFGCCGNILRQKNNAECCYATIDWENNISQYPYDAGDPIRSYGCEQSRIPTLPNMLWNRKRDIFTTRQNESKLSEESGCRPTTQPQVFQELVRLSKNNIRTGEYSYDRRKPYNPRKQRFNERYFEKDTITGEPLPIRGRPTEYNQDTSLLSYNFNTPGTAEIEEKNKFPNTNTQNEYKPRIRQQSHFGNTGRPPFDCYCNIRHGIGQIMPANRKPFKEEFSKISRRAFPYETTYSSPTQIRSTDCRRVQQFGEKNKEKFDCSCCCHVNKNLNHNNYIYGVVNPFDIICNSNNFSNKNYATIKKPHIGNNLNQFRNKMEQRLLCHKQYGSDSDRASDDEFNTMLMNKCNAERTNNNIYSANLNNRQNGKLSSINENPLWKHNCISTKNPKEEGDILLAPHNSNNRVKNDIYMSNLYSSNNETLCKYRRSILQGRRGEGGRIFKENNSMQNITNTGYTLNLHSSDDETSSKYRRSILQSPRGEGGMLVKPNNSIVDIIYKDRTSSILLSDDEHSVSSNNRGTGGKRFFNPKNSIHRFTKRFHTADNESSLKYQCAKGESKNLQRLPKSDFIDCVNNRRNMSNVFSSYEKTTLEPRRSILQGPRGEGGEILTPNNSHNLIGRSNRYNDPEPSLNYQCVRGESKNLQTLPKSDSIDRVNNRRNKSNVFSSDDETTLEPRRSILQGPRGEGGRILTPNNSHNLIGRSIRYNDPEPSLNYQCIRGESKNLQRLPKSDFIDRVNNRRNKSNVFSSDDETTLEPRRSFLQGPRGEGGRILTPNNSDNLIGRSNRYNDPEPSLNYQCVSGKIKNLQRLPKSDFIDRVKNRRNKSNVYSSDDETTLEPRRSILQGPRGEGGRILTPNNSDNLIGSSNRYNRSLSEDEDFLKPLPRIKLNLNTSIHNNTNPVLPNCENGFIGNNMESDYSNVRNSTGRYGIFPLSNNLNTGKTNRSNFSSSEDETFSKPLPQILEGQRDKTSNIGNYSNIFCSKKNRISRQLSSDDETFSTPRSILKDPIRECCSNSSSFIHNKKGSSSKSNLTPSVDRISAVDYISLKPRRSILQSQRGEGGGFLKRIDSNKSVIFNRSHTSSQMTVYLNSEDEEKKTITTNNNKNRQQKKYNLPSYLNFTRNFQLPCCKPIDNEESDIKSSKKRASASIASKKTNKSSFSARSAPVQSVTNNRSIPVRRTNSASPNRSTIRTTSNLPQIGSKNISFDQLQNKGTKNKNSSIFRYLNELQLLTLRSKNITNITRKKYLSTARINYKKNNEIKSTVADKPSIKPKNLNAANKIYRNAVPFKYK